MNTSADTLINSHGIEIHDLRREVNDVKQDLSDVRITMEKLITVSDHTNASLNNITNELAKASDNFREYNKTVYEVNNIGTMVLNMQKSQESMKEDLTIIKTSFGKQNKREDNYWNRLRGIDTIVTLCGILLLAMTQYIGYNLSKSHPSTPASYQGDILNNG